MKKEYSIIINKQKSILNRQLSIFQHDKGVDIYFKLMDTDYLDLSSNYLLSDIVLVSPLKKQIKSDIVPIIDNKILFTINNEIMNQIDEIGNYHVHIRIYDDKGGRIKLPHFTMSVEECEVDDDDLSYGTVDGTAIDNTKVAKYGKELKTFNDDGSYNRTIWIAGDIITEDTPIIISELGKGSYILKGWVKDFNSSTEIRHLDGNKNYAYITSNEEEQTYGLQCFDGDDSFKLYKFNKLKNLKEQIVDYLHLVELDEENNLNLTGDKYQYLRTNSQSTVVLPKTTEFIELNLFIRPEVDNLILIFPPVAWRTQPVLKRNVLCQIKLHYLNDAWYGDTTIHDEDVPIVKDNKINNTTGNYSFGYKEISSEIGRI